MAAAPTAESVRGALLRYRVMAFVVGTTLLVFCVAIVLKYVTKTIESDSLVAIAHGWLFMIYVLLGLDLGFRMRWSVGRLLLMTVSGMVPFLSFYAEHKVTAWVRDELGTPSAPAAAEPTAPQRWTYFVVELVPLTVFVLAGVLFWVSGRKTRMDLATADEIAAAKIV